MPKIIVMDIAGDKPIGSFEIVVESATCTAEALIRAKVEAEHQKVTEAFSAQSGMMAKLAEALSGELEPMIEQSMTAFSNKAYSLSVDGNDVTDPGQVLQVRDGSQAVFRRPANADVPQST